jgi:FKBP-type peptidyl-prolyl cis-trans isomerase 2
MQKAKAGDRITVHYVGTLDNGRIFDQRDADQPLVLTLGAEDIFPELEKAIIGMAVGEVKNIHLPAELAYGLRLDENLLRVSRDLFPSGRALRIGQKMSVELGDSSQRFMRIRQIDDREVLLDGNHDLAGCDLTFALQLVAIA